MIYDSNKLLYLIDYLSGIRMLMKNKFEDLLNLNLHIVTKILLHYCNLLVFCKNEQDSSK